MLLKSKVVLSYLCTNNTFVVAIMNKFFQKTHLKSIEHEVEKY